MRATLAVAQTENKINNEQLSMKSTEEYLHTDLIPSVWCPGCGIGTVVYTFIEAVKEAEIDPNNLYVVAGIGCTGKVTEYLKFNSFNVTNVVNYAVNFKLEHPTLKVVVFSDNADFLISGAKDFIEAGKKIGTRYGVSLLVIHINNIIYTVTENKAIPITPFMRTSIDKDFELPFNIPHLAKSCGAQYVARWTPLRAGWLKYSMIDTFFKQGFSVIEVISPCLMYYTDNKRIGDAVERMEFYDTSSVMKQDEPTENLDIRARNKIIIGKFVDKKCIEVDRRVQSKSIK